MPDLSSNLQATAGFLYRYARQCLQAYSNVDNIKNEVNRLFRYNMQLRGTLVESEKSLHKIKESQSNLIKGFITISFLNVAVLSYALKTLNKYNLSMHALERLMQLSTSLFLGSLFVNYVYPIGLKLFTAIVVFFQ